jgi:hypothetical protein
VNTTDSLFLLVCASLRRNPQLPTHQNSWERRDNLPPPTFKIEVATGNLTAVYLRNQQKLAGGFAALEIAVGPRRIPQGIDVLDA